MAKKTSVRITGISEARDAALKFLNESTKDSDFLTYIAKQTVDQMRKAVQDRQEEYKQPDLKQSTIEARKILESTNGAGDFFKPKLSNLTMTGQLLKSLNFKINSKLAEIIVYLKDARSNTRPLSNTEARVLTQQISKKKNKTDLDRARLAGIRLATKEKPNKTNSEIKNDLESRGRKFFFLSDKINTLLNNEATKELRRRLDLYTKITRKLK